MSIPAISTSSPLLSTSMYGPGGKHPIFPKVSPGWRIDNNYQIRCKLQYNMDTTPSPECYSSNRGPVVIQENHLTIRLATTRVPKAYETSPPFYSITLTAAQRQTGPAPRLGIQEESEIWGEDGLDQMHRVVIGKCLGQVRGHFMFPCWACDGVCDSACDHRLCSYGIMKVDRALLHPLFNQASIPELPLLAFQMNEFWRSIPIERHLRLAIAYPPGYQCDMTTWYEFYPPIAVFMTEMEAEYVRAEQRRRGWIVENDRERQQRLMEESRMERRFAHHALRLAKVIAEACQAAYLERTYRHFLRAVGGRA
ncbi:uncharacterized protein STEHIDRAFT_157896 [Stereum hirsutum FP-91666 SS1]|uniref:uncharacterized protein n=1 Tax=Stereum hirsutum (strain FP-91666) TaxID=721885 RepID=UPI00044493DD|nr:uncharacterized protein STEHIDRAFT_157896 [Stereum hirsutum FP-91666 SS1]EIM85258.1 hypothetical protein STEHIDRAFT_157896 [Stereum hirsutum FP-91666 SS1]